MTEEIKKQAQRLTTEGGYRAIVPDLYKGKIGVDAEVLHEYRGTLLLPISMSTVARGTRLSFRIWLYD